jgi:hypothetical protein
MWQVTAIHVKMMLRYFVGNNHKVIWVLLVMLVLFWLELTQWLPIYGFCSIFFAFHKHGFTGATENTRQNLVS